MSERSTSVTELCDELAKELTRVGRHVASRLRPGLPGTELERYEQELKLKFPAALRELYGWRNGTDGADERLVDIYFVPWLYFSELSEAVAKYRATLGQPGLKREWLPIFETGGGGWLLVDCRTGRVLRWSSGARTKEQYLGIREMLATWLECYRTGCFFVDEGELKLRHEQFRQIGTRHNPGLAYWLELPKES